MRNYFVYILASDRNGTLYTGVTSNILGRTYQHKEGLAEGFTKRYSVKRLVWFEPHTPMSGTPSSARRTSNTGRAPGSWL
jgi:putative endonuclease